MSAPFDPGQRKMFPDVYDNIDKIDFDVLVQENYSATVNIVHNSAVFGDKQPPPIRQLDDFNYNDICHASLSTRYIVDALVNGKFIEFLYTSDMLFMQKWLKDYIAQCENVDLTNHPDYVAFINNCKTALHMLDTNVKRYNDVQAQREKAKTTPNILDLMSFM